MYDAIDEHLTKAFHAMYYLSDVWNKGNTRWLGVPCFQTPLDLWGMQEIIYDTKPNLIIETGSACGGTALFLSSVLDQLGDDEAFKIVSIDTQEGMKPMIGHPKITFLIGRSTDGDILKAIDLMIHQSDKVMVLLDSDHSTKNVLAELQAYHKFVTPGCYLLIHDTNLGGNPINIGEVEDPMKAVRSFLEENNDFEIDESREKFHLTFMPNGWLRKKGG